MKHLQSYTYAGTHQSERYTQAIDPSFIPIDERSLKDLVEQLACYAKEVKYYNEFNLEDGDWTAFFEEIYDYEKKQVKFENIETLEAKADSSPHIAVLLSFLQLYLKEIENLNTFTAKHLDFYYKELLKLKKKEPKPDKTILVFEPELNVEKVHLPRNTELVAYYDENADEVIYKTLSELEVTQSQASKIEIIDLKHKDTYPSNEQEALILASPLFNMPEGDRTIYLTFYLSKPLEIGTSEGDTDIPELKFDIPEIEYSTPNGWGKVSEVDLSNLESMLREQQLYEQQSEDQVYVTVPIKIDKNQSACSSCNNELHGAGIHTEFAALRIKINENNRSFLSFMETSSIQEISTNVKGVEQLFLQNDHGIIDGSLPFLPFGAMPEKGVSSFIIGHKDIFHKYLNHFSLNVKWLGKPENLDDYYEDYINYFAEDSGVKEQNNGDDKGKITKHIDLLRVVSSEIKKHIPANIEVLNLGKWESIDKQCFNQSCYDIHNVITAKPLKENIQCFKNSYDAGFIRLTLNANFGHKLYPELLKRSINEVTVDDNSLSGTYIPKPYTPKIQSISLDYQTSFSNYTTKDSNNLNEVLQIYHVKKHEYRKINDKLEGILNSFEFDQEVLIGISSFQSPSVLHLYFHLENSQGDIAAENPMVWYIPEKDIWRPLKSHEIIQDTTLNFSRSGIVSFRFPKKIETISSLMDASDLFWLKLGLKKNKDQNYHYPKIKGVYTNAVEAVCELKGRNLPHLSEGLPQKTIEKLKCKTEGIKTIVQIEKSYGGIAKEKTKEFYTRVSERLKHKNRAWNIWDLERLILSHFPSVAYAKCLRTKEIGVVQVLVSPFVSTSVDKERQTDPKFSKSNKEEIKAYIQAYTSPFTRVEIRDPQYEYLTVNCKLVLKKDCYDYQFYQDLLNQNLIQFLTLSHNDLKRDPSNTLYVSSIIKFVEKQEYVDWIKTITVKKESLNNNNPTLNSEVIFSADDMISGNNAFSVLTSAYKHEIDFDYE